MAKGRYEVQYFRAAEFKVPDEVMRRAKEGDAAAKQQVRDAGIAAMEKLNPPHDFHCADWCDSRGQVVDSHDA